MWIASLGKTQDSRQYLVAGRVDELKRYRSPFSYPPVYIKQGIQKGRDSCRWWRFDTTEHNGRTQANLPVSFSEQVKQHRYRVWIGLDNGRHSAKPKVLAAPDQRDGQDIGL
jgi:hypothetical protein